MKEERRHFDHQNQPKIYDAKFNKYIHGANEKNCSGLKRPFWVRWFQNLKVGGSIHRRSLSQIRPAYQTYQWVIAHAITQFSYQDSYRSAVNTAIDAFQKSVFTAL